MNEFYQTYPVGTRVKVTWAATYDSEEITIMGTVVENDQDIPGWEYTVRVELDKNCPWGHKVRSARPYMLTKV